MGDAPPTDAELLAALHAERDPVQFAERLHAFYGDVERAQRTPRELLYLHLGIATGMILRLAAPAGGRLRDDG
jgi:hypothetical protein